MNFEKHNDPLKSLTIGREYLIIEWLDAMGIKNYVINDDSTIDVNGFVGLSSKGLIELPDFIQFNNVKESFICANNKLVTLRGCPKFVGGSFVCRDNNLTSLKYSPEVVLRNFYSYNNLSNFSYIDILEVCRTTEAMYP